MTAIVWPISILKPQNAHVSKMSASVIGNASIAGGSQTSASDIGRWSLDMDGININTPEKVKLWRAIEGLAEGKLGQFLVPVCEYGMRPYPRGKVEGVVHSDGSTFSDGSTYAQPQYTARMLSAVTRGSVQCVIQYDADQEPEPGMGFEVGVGRYHHITRVIARADHAVTVKVWPTFRTAVLAGTACNFDNPHMLCRLADDGQMSIPTLDLLRFARPSLSFIEDTGPLA